MDQTRTSPLLERAWRAYRTTDGARAEQPVLARCGEVEIAGLRYIELANEHGTLAVYRLKNSGALRRMRQPPL